jgi:lipoprotein-anchoring transpeptidase ErfK/SrfK
MSLPKTILFGSISLFVLIGVMAFVKKKGSKPEIVNPIEHSIEMKKAQETIASSSYIPKPPSAPLPPPPPVADVIAVEDDFPVMDRIHQLFTTGPSKLPIVETVTYTSSVPWLKGRPAWIADYASHYQTSRHFIARSLNGKSDYLTQRVTKGSRFNVFRPDKKIQFYLLIDVSRCKMGFYYVDLETQERVLLKTYRVGLGRADSKATTGLLTPLGKYSLGSKVAIYKPGIVGTFQGRPTEMVSIFGTRWIPFEQDLEGATASAKGYGIHGAPWIQDENGKFTENNACIGTYDSDGCIRLSLEDIEELFAIVITKPTFVEIVKNFHEAKLPGKEVATPINR